MKVSIIGQGYVGLTLALFASEKHEVIGLDLNQVLVENLNNGISHVEGVSGEFLKKRFLQGNYRATSDPTEIDGSEIVIIAVPTPLTHDKKPDLSFIESACQIIGKNLKNSALVINESTSYPGTVRNFISKEISKISPRSNHLYAVSPERVDPGRADFNQKNTPRLFAGLTSEATARTREFYSAFCDNLVEVSSPEVAEAAKLFENTFRQVNIALVNEFAQIAHVLGISVRETLEAANTKPYGFMKFNPSAGVGGHCIPVDPSYLAKSAEVHGVKAKFIELSNKVNLEMGEYIANRIAEDNGGSLTGKTVQIVGVSYKANIADVRETPAEELFKALKHRGAEVSWHDPLVKKWNQSESSELGAEIGVLVTFHDQFKKFDLASEFKYLFDTTGNIKIAKQL